VRPELQAVVRRRADGGSCPTGAVRAARVLERARFRNAEASIVHTPAGWIATKKYTACKT
jgi:hypothetical protein